MHTHTHIYTYIYLVSKLVICPTGQFHSTYFYRTLALEKYVPDGFPVRQTKNCKQDIYVELLLTPEQLFHQIRDCPTRLTCK